MDRRWNQLPLFSNRFDGDNFLMCTPPATRPILGPNDSALLAVLVASLLAINQQVADSVFRSPHLCTCPSIIPSPRRTLPLPKLLATVGLYFLRWRNHEGF